MAARKIRSYLMAHAPVLFLELDNAGTILCINRTAGDTLGNGIINRRLQHLMLDFSREFDLPAAADSGENLLASLVCGNGDPQSFRLWFHREEERIIVLGHLDEEDTFLMQGEIVRLNQQLNNLTRDLHKKNARLQQALDHVKQLQGIIPICMHCHKIRNDDEIWEQLEAYLYEHTDAKLSHGVCPECMDKYYPEDMDI